MFLVVSGRMFLVGLSQGPPHHYWYIYLDKLLPKKTLRTVCVKILADQIIAAPFFAITFLIGMGILEDKRLSECWSEFIKKFPVVYMVSHLINSSYESWESSNRIEKSIILMTYHCITHSSIG